MIFTDEARRRLAEVYWTQQRDEGEPVFNEFLGLLGNTDPALAEATAGTKLIVRVDRTELSKNIARGLAAYRELLIAHPEWRGRVIHVAFAYPSRTDLPEYRAYTASVQRLAREIHDGIAQEVASLRSGVSSGCSARLSHSPPRSTISAAIRRMPNNRMTTCRSIACRAACGFVALLSST